MFTDKSFEHFSSTRIMFKEKSLKFENSANGKIKVGIMCSSPEIENSEQIANTIVFSGGRCTQFKTFCH